MKEINNQNNVSKYALLPLVVFLVVYLLTSIIIGDFYKMPVLVAVLIAVAVAFIMKRNIKLNDKIDIFCKGAGNPNIIIMILVFVLAGAFGKVASDMGAVDSTVNLGLSILPSSILLCGVFIIGCFISISVGTSVGTIAAIAPMAVGIAEKSNISVALAVGAVVCGAMFGDNLSMISDTTIAATRTQGCEMKDKFKTNFLIVLPAAILTAIIYITMNTSAVESDIVYNYDLIKVFPYVAVLVAAIMGLNVFFLLGGGTVLTGLIGLYTGAFDIWGLFKSISDGMLGMAEIIILSILIGGMVELVKHYGGINYLLQAITKRIKSKKGAELGIGLLVGIIDICTANNTIAIVMAGPIAKDIADEFDVEPSRAASLLDTFSCFAQGIIPYGAQLLYASSAAGISSLEIMKYLYYPYLMIIFALGAIILGDRKTSRQ